MWVKWKHPKLKKIICAVSSDFFPKRRSGQSWHKRNGIPFYLIKRLEDGSSCKGYIAYNALTRNKVDYGWTKEELKEKINKNYPKNLELDLMPSEYEKYIISKHESKKKKKKGKK